MDRRKLVAGNWKMNGLMADLDQLEAVNVKSYYASVDVAVCLPATLIREAAIAFSSLPIGGQDCHWDEKGAYTGWVSAEMLREARAVYVIVGHSERRLGACETDTQVSGKATAALDAGLIPIICVGESEEERARGEHIARVTAQVQACLPKQVNENVVIAYEPIWAIGTGKTATESDIAEMHAAIRASLRKSHSQPADGMRIIYGGSVKAINALQIFRIPNVDGALVGGASLTAREFLPIIDCAIETTKGPLPGPPRRLN